MKSVLVLNGPNLNLLGKREPHLYGGRTFQDLEILCRDACEQFGFVMDFRQSNHEGDLVDWLQEAGRLQASGQLCGVVFNAGAYTHTSLALQDAVKAASLRIIEVHISNIYAREEVRRASFLSPVAAGILCGFGLEGYALAIAGLAALDRHPN